MILEHTSSFSDSLLKAFHTERDCLESRLLTVAESSIRSYEPVAACVYFTLGVHLSIWILGSTQLAWLPVIAIATAALWAIVSLLTFLGREKTNQMMPGVHKAIETLLGFHFGYGMLGIGMLVLSLCMIVPSSAGMAVWFFSCLFVLAAPTYGIILVPIVAAGLVLTGGFWLLTSLVGWGFLHLWMGRCFALLTAGLICNFLIVRFRESRKNFWSLHSLVPLVLPLTLAIFPVGSSYRLSVAFLLLWPTVLYFYNLTFWWKAKRGARALVANHGIAEVLGRDIDPIREQKLLRQANRIPEDEVRESDGYCRLYSPEYRHFVPELTGEAGYVTWLTPRSDCVIFRATSLYSQPCSDLSDKIGNTLSSFAKTLVPRC